MKVDSKLLKHYLDGNESVEGKECLYEWFNDLKSEKDLKVVSREIWDNTGITQNDEDYNYEVVLAKIYRRIKEEENFFIRKPGTGKRIFSYFAKVAAIIFIPLLLAFLFHNRLGIKNSEISATYSEIYSPLGSRTMFYLPDGSKGWLNGGSFIKFPDKFSSKVRNVSVKGEAYFDVVSNSKWPFIVSSENLKIIAKGTSFNVKAFGNEKTTEVVLTEGALEILHNDNINETMLTRMRPGELFVFNNENSKMLLSSVDVDKFISWTEGKLVFRDDNFSEVVSKINRWYNVNMIIKDEELRSYKYVATFQDESLDEILRMLKISAPIVYKNIERKQGADGTFEKRTIELYYHPLKK